MARLPRDARMHTDSDISSIKETIGHHDARIDDLGRRIGGVEHQVRSLAGEVSKGFSDLGAKLSGLEQGKGPGFGKISAVALTVVSIVALLCGGIIWFVSSIVAPDTTKLVGTNEKQDVIIGKLDADREEDYRRLRQERNEREEERIRRLEERLGWVPKEITRDP